MGFRRTLRFYPLFITTVQNKKKINKNQPLEFKPEGVGHSKPALEPLPYLILNPCNFLNDILKIFLKNDVLKFKKII